MNIGAILVGIALLIGVVAYVARPLFERPADENGKRATGASPYSELAARRDAIYALIRELEADFQTGKVNNVDFQTQRSRYVAEGVAVLKEIDALSGSLEAEIEARVQALRQVDSPHPATGHQPAARFCTQCGHPVDVDDRFCARCGEPLKETALP